MKKIILLFLAIFFTLVSVFADENYSYMISPNADYTLFCPEKFSTFEIKNSGVLNFKFVADIMNTKSVMSIRTKNNNGTATASFTTPNGKINYKFTVDDKNTQELYDNNFFLIDTPPISSVNKSINKND